MKRKGLLKLIIPISLILALAVALPLMSGCRPAPPPEVAPPEVAPPEVAPPEVAPPEVAPPEPVEPIKVGVPLPMTGWYAADGVTYFQGINMAVAEINAAGGLLGRPLEIIRFDHHNFEPEIVMEGADYLVGAIKVDVVHAAWAGYGADVKVYGKYDPPYFNYNASISAIEVFRSDPDLYWNSFQMNDIEEPYGRYLFEVMMMLPYEYPNNKVALIAADDPWSRSVVAGFGLQAEEAGWEIVMDEVVPYGVTEWGALLTEIRALDPAIIAFELISPPELITFFRQFMEEPTNSLIQLFWGGILREFQEILGEEGDGLTMLSVGGVALPVAQTQEAQEFLDRYRFTYGVAPTAGATAVYDGVMFWADAVRAVGDPTDYRAICQYIADTRWQTASATGVWEFDEDQKLLNTPDYPAHLTQIQGGDFVTIYLYTEEYVDCEGTASYFQVPPWIE